MASNEELQKTLQILSTSVKSIQDELTTLKRGAIQNGADLQQSGSSKQSSSTDLAGLTLPPQKRTRQEDDEGISDDEVEDNDTSQGPVVPISEVAAASWKLRSV